MLSDKYFKLLEEQNFTADQIDRLRGSVNRKVAQRGENASEELLFLADFLNSAEADFGNMVMQGATFNFSDEIAAKFQRKVPDNLYVAVRNNAMDAYKADKPIKATIAQVGGALIPTAVEGFFTARKIRKDNKTGYKGVSWSPRLNKWYSQIQTSRFISRRAHHKTGYH
jgi:hypothetical protein